MILLLPLIKDEKLMTKIDDVVADLVWEDGRKTAGKTAAAVKQNEQADLSKGEGPRLYKTLLKLMTEHNIVTAAARPKQFSHLMVSRTTDGGHYGEHIDNPIMGKFGNQIRTDISFTIFLSDPDSYEGGELVIHQTGSRRSIKGKRGQVVLYPTNAVHEVRPVTKGERIVSVGWIESFIADVGQRELLFDLATARAGLLEKLDANDPEVLKIDKALSNLTRMWAKR